MPYAVVFLNIGYTTFAVSPCVSSAASSTGTGSFRGYLAGVPLLLLETGRPIPNLECKTWCVRGGGGGGGARN